MLYFNLEKELKCYENNTALITEEGEHISYRTLLACIREIDSCIRKRSVCICLCENTAGSIAGYLAFLQAGVIPLLIDCKTDSSFLQKLIESYEPEYLYVPSRLKKTAAEILRGILKEKPTEDIWFREDWDYCLIQTTFKPEIRPEESLALLLTTSGSTGSPKLVRISYENLEANTRSIIEYLQIDEKQRAITVLPMHYTYGLSVINTHIKAGASIVLTTKSVVDPGFWMQMTNGHVTSFVGVPFIYETLKKLRFFRMDLPDLKVMTQAGGKLSKGLQKEFTGYAAAAGKKLIVMYGQTEATARMSYLPFEKASCKIGSIGIAIPGGRFFLVNETGETILTTDTEGELCYEGKNVTLGYALCRKDLAKEDERQGILHTGDIAKRDADGFYYITGRKKRFLKLLGSRVNLDEIEQILKNETGLSELAAVGEDEHLIICEAEKKEIKTTAAAIEEILLYKMHISSHVITVRHVEKIPRNEAGKILYNRLII